MLSVCLSVWNIFLIIQYWKTNPYISAKKKDIETKLSGYDPWGLHSTSWGYIRVTYWLLWSYWLKLTHWNWRTRIDLLKLSDWTCKKVTHWNWETKTNWLNDSDRLNLTVQNRQTETDKLKMTDWKSLSDTNWLKLTDLYQVGAIDLWSCSLSFHIWIIVCTNWPIMFEYLFNKTRGL